ncbi:MAG: hypothetical protein ACUVX9_13745 [Anaerolineae bacterium]
MRRVTLATTDGLGVYAGTRYPDGAWELVKFLVHKDYGWAMARPSLRQPARASLVEEWASLVRAQFPAQAKEVDIAAFADGHLKGYSLTAEIFGNMAEAKRLASEAWDQILTLGAAPAASFKTTCEKIEAAQGAHSDLAGGCC